MQRQLTAPPVPTLSLAKQQTRNSSRTHKSAHMSATSRHETAPYVHCALTVPLQQSTPVTVSGVLVSQHTDTHRPCPPCTCVMAFYHLSSVLRRDRDASHARHDLSSLLVLLPIRGVSRSYPFRARARRMGRNLSHVSFQSALHMQRRNGSRLSSHASPCSCCTSKHHGGRQSTLILDSLLVACKDRLHFLSSENRYEQHRFPF